MVDKAGMYYWSESSFRSLFPAFKSFLAFIFHPLYHICGCRRPRCAFVAALLQMAGSRQPISDSCCYPAGRGRSLWPDSLFFHESYFQVLKIYSDDLFRRASASFTSQDSFRGVSSKAYLPTIFCLEEEFSGFYICPLRRSGEDA